MGSEVLWDAIRRSVEERNKDPERMRRWLEDWEDRYDDYGGGEEAADDE